MHKSPTGNLPDPHSNYGNIQVRGKPENSSATPVTTWDQKRESLTNITTLNIIGPIATKNIVKNLLPPPLLGDFRAQTRPEDQHIDHNRS